MEHWVKLFVELDLALCGVLTVHHVGFEVLGLTPQNTGMSIRSFQLFSDTVLNLMIFATVILFASPA